MKKKLLFSDGSYSIWRHSGIPLEAISFLDNISWGNSGAVYEHKNTKERILSLHNPTLIAIHEGEKIQATGVFCNTYISAGNAKYNCYYIRYFAASKEIRGKGIIKHLAVKVMTMIRDNETEKTVFMACIEKGNKASYKTVSNAGYKEIGKVKTNGFSRFFPQANRNMEQVKTDAVRNEVMVLLQKEYHEYAIVQFNSIFLRDNYYVIRKNGEIVAGCQYHRAHWVINNMPGLMGMVIMNIVPMVPFLNKLFNPKSFEFLGYEGIYVKPGHEKDLMRLFEGLLAKEKLNSAMFWFSEECELRKNILKNCKLGLIHSFVKNSDILILTSFHSLDKSEIVNLMSRPLYASAFDYM